MSIHAKINTQLLTKLRQKRYFPLLAAVPFFGLVGFVHAITKLPKRLVAFISHVLFLDFFSSPRNEKNWFWFPLLLFKGLDCLLILDYFSVLLVFIKPFHRTLTEQEIAEATKVYGEDFPYWKVGIDTFSLFAWIGMKLTGKNQLGVVVFRTINFTRPIHCDKHKGDMEWLIHELMHIQQQEEVGSSYIFYSLYAQFTSGYAIPEKLRPSLNQYNFEQQAEIARYIYQDPEGLESLQQDILVRKFV